MPDETEPKLRRVLRYQLLGEGRGGRGGITMTMATLTTLMMMMTMMLR